MQGKYKKTEEKRNNDVTGIIEKAKFPVKPNVRKKGEKLIATLKRKKTQERQKARISIKKYYCDCIYKYAQFNFRSILNVNSSGMLEKIKVLDCYPCYQSNFVSQHM